MGAAEKTRKTATPPEGSRTVVVEGRNGLKAAKAYEAERPTEAVISTTPLVDGGLELVVVDRTPIPVPLPANSRRLSSSRFEAGVYGPADERTTARQEIARGRFESAQDARRWADATYPEAEFVALDFLSASTGWVRRRHDHRADGAWQWEAV